MSAYPSLIASLRLSWAQGLAAALLAGVLIGCDSVTPPAPPPSSPPAAFASADNVIENAFRERRSGFMVDIAGTVQRQLPDDNKGSRHQRFILRLASGRTLLISHNIDLAPRIDALRVGDAIELRGQYEWNPQGGVIHWTHHDPNGRHEEGWIRHRERLYQ